MKILEIFDKDVVTDVKINKELEGIKLIFNNGEKELIAKFEPEYFQDFLKWRESPKQDLSNGLSDFYDRYKDDLTAWECKCIKGVHKAIKERK